jgi:3-phosphoshikimate 1-carboxyvinyltransferase
MQHPVHPVKAPVRARISIPGSKTISHRAIMLAALADGVSEISGIKIDNETRTYITALHQAGIVIQVDEKSSSCIIAGGNGKFPKQQSTIWCGGLTDTAYYLMAACSATPGVHYFDTLPASHTQSFTGLLNILRRQGMQLIPNDVKEMPFTIIGADTLIGGDIIFDADTTTAQISALLMIAPFTRSPFNFTLVDHTQQIFTDLTCAMMAEFGVLTHRLHQGQFMVPVPQRYHAKDYMVEPDFALASYFFAAAALTHGEITIPAIKRAQSKQMNVKCLSVLEKMGCIIIENENATTLKGPVTLNGIEISLREFSDIFLAIAAIAPFADSPTCITHSDQPREEEITLLKTVKDILEKMHIRVESEENWIKIYPGMPRGTTINTLGDPRVGMAFALIGLKVPGVTIENAQSINEFWPEFFPLWKKLTEPDSAAVT